MENDLAGVMIGFWKGWSSWFTWAGPLQYPLAGFFLLGFLKEVLVWLGKLGAQPQPQEPQVMDVVRVRQQIVARVRKENPNISKADLDREVRESLVRVKAVARKQGFVIPAEGEE